MGLRTSASRSSLFGLREFTLTAEDDPLSDPRLERAGIQFQRRVKSILCLIQGALPEQEIAPAGWPRTSVGLSFISLRRASISSALSGSPGKAGAPCAVVSTSRRPYRYPALLQAEEKNTAHNRETGKDEKHPFLLHDLKSPSFPFAYSSYLFLTGFFRS